MTMRAFSVAGATVNAVITGFLQNLENAIQIWFHNENVGLVATLFPSFDSESSQSFPAEEKSDWGADEVKSTV